MPTEEWQREAFDKWFAEECEELNPLGTEAGRIYPVWQAAYRAGEAAGLERAAQMVDNNLGHCTVLAKAIRALTRFRD